MLLRCGTIPRYGTQRRYSGNYPPSSGTRTSQHWMYRTKMMAAGPSHLLHTSRDRHSPASRQSGGRPSHFTHSQRPRHGRTANGTIRTGQQRISGNEAPSSCAMPAGHRHRRHPHLLSWVIPDVGRVGSGEARAPTPVVQCSLLRRFQKNAKLPRCSNCGARESQ